MNLLKKTKQTDILTYECCLAAGQDHPHQPGPAQPQPDLHQEGTSGVKNKKVDLLHFDGFSKLLLTNWQEGWTILDKN